MQRESHDPMSSFYMHMSESPHPHLLVRSPISCCTSGFDPVVVPTGWQVRRLTSVGGASAVTLAIAAKG